MTPDEARLVIANKQKMPPEKVREAARLLVEERKSKDPIVQFVPGPTQRRFLESKTRYRLIGGPNRVGKSAAIAWLIASCALRRNPVWSTSVNGVYVVMAPRRDQIRDPWFKKLFQESEIKGSAKQSPLIPSTEIVKIHYTYGAGEPTPKVAELKNGNRIWFTASGNAEAWKGLEGKGMILGVAMDESAGTQQLLDEATVRLLDAHSDDTVKKDCGGGWLVWGATETKINEAYTGFMEKCNDPSFTDFEAFIAGPDENPAIDPEERKKFDQVLSEDVYKSRMRGEGGALATLQVYPQFNADQHVMATDYEPTDEDSIWIGYDPGAHFTGIVFAAFSKDHPRRGRIFRCAEMKRSSVEQDISLMIRAVRGRKVERLIYDQAALKVEKSAGASLATQLAREAHRQGLKFWVPMTRGRSRYEDSVPILRNAFANGDVLINPSASSGCKILVSEINGCRFTETSGLLKESNITKGNDHCSDALRYLWSIYPHWTDRGINRATMLPTDGPLKVAVDPMAALEAEKMRRSKIIAAQVLMPGMDWRIVG